MGNAGPHVFVNRRRFDAADGVRSGMDAAALAALVGVPADNAVVEVETAEGLKEVAPSEVVAVVDGLHVLVTRQFVMGGTPPSRR